MKIISVVGARPNFMKVAPIHRALVRSGHFNSLIVHTGQHYDERMSDIFFRQLEMPEPDVHLGVGSGTHAQQTAGVMTAFEEVVLKEKPDLVIVVGDVNSTLACSLVATKCHIPVAHVEAGLRSGDRSMPEEINRIVTDSIADYLFVTEKSGEENLLAEGISHSKIYFVGNVMIDSLVRFREKASQSHILDQLGVSGKEYALMTMHRPSNVDVEEGLTSLLAIMRRIAASRALLFPMHPRTRQRFRDFGLDEELSEIDNLRITEPLGYIEFLRLMEEAAVVITDSGGIQEETTFLRVPCLTIRDSTERPVTVESGYNELLPLDPEVVARRADSVSGRVKENGTVPPLWDGRASERIVGVLEDLAEKQTQTKAA